MNSDQIYKNPKQKNQTQLNRNQQQFQILKIDYEDLEFQQKINKGTKCEVYQGLCKASCQFQNQLLAIKKYQGNLKSNQEDYKNFKQQLIAMNQMGSQENSIEILGYSINKKPCLLLGLYQKNLRDHFIKYQNQKHLDLNTVLKIAIQIAQGMAQFHDSTGKTIHGNLTPDCILLTKQNDAKIGEFALSKILNNLTPFDYSSKSLYGTNRYQPPEFFQNLQLTRKSDIYSYGCILAELLTYNFPWHKLENSKAVTYHIERRIKKQEFDLLQKEIYQMINKEEIQQENYSKQLIKLIQKCLQIDKEQRPHFSQIIFTLNSIQQEQNQHQQNKNQKNYNQDKNQQNQNNYSSKMVNKYQNKTYDIKDKNKHQDKIKDKDLNRFKKQQIQMNQFQAKNIYNDSDEESDSAMPQLQNQETVQGGLTFPYQQTNQINKIKKDKQNQKSCQKEFTDNKSRKQQKYQQHFEYQNNHNQQLHDIQEDSQEYKSHQFSKNIDDSSEDEYEQNLRKLEQHKKQSKKQTNIQQNSKHQYLNENFKNQQKQNQYKIHEPYIPNENEIETNISKTQFKQKFDQSDSDPSLDQAVYTRLNAEEEKQKLKQQQKQTQQNQKPDKHKKDLNNKKCVQFGKDLFKNKQKNSDFDLGDIQQLQLKKQPTVQAGMKLQDQQFQQNNGSGQEDQFNISQQKQIKCQENSFQINNELFNIPNQAQFQENEIEINKKDKHDKKDKQKKKQKQKGSKDQKEIMKLQQQQKEEQEKKLLKQEFSDFSIALPQNPQKIKKYKQKQQQNGQDQNQNLMDDIFNKEQNQQNQVDQQDNSQHKINDMIIQGNNNKNQNPWNMQLMGGNTKQEKNQESTNNEEINPFENKGSSKDNSQKSVVIKNEGQKQDDDEFNMNF